MDMLDEQMRRSHTQIIFTGYTCEENMSGSKRK